MEDKENISMNGQSFRLIIFYFFVLLLVLMIGCKKDDNPVAHGLYTVTGRSNGQTLVYTDSVLVAKNPFGPVVVDWAGDDTMLYWSINKTTKAPTQAEANASQGYVSIASHSNHDTMFVEVVIPPDKLGYQYTCLLSLELPFLMYYDTTGTFKRMSSSNSHE